MIRRLVLLLAFVFAGFVPAVAQTQSTTHQSHPQGRPHDPNHPAMDPAMHADLHARFHGSWTGTVTSPAGVSTKLQLAVVTDKHGTDIFARRQKQVDDAWHAMQPHVRATLESTHQEIIGLLRPEQAAKFRKMMETMHPGGHR